MHGPPCGPTGTVPAEQSADIPAGKSSLTFGGLLRDFLARNFWGTLMMRGKVAAWIYALDDKGCSHSFFTPGKNKKLGPRLPVATVLKINYKPITAQGSFNFTLSSTNTLMVT